MGQKAKKRKGKRFKKNEGEEMTKPRSSCIRSGLRPSPRGQGCCLLVKAALRYVQVIAIRQTTRRHQTDGKRGGGTQT